MQDAVIGKKYSQIGSIHAPASYKLSKDQGSSLGIQHQNANLGKGGGEGERRKERGRERELKNGISNEGDGTRSDETGWDGMGMGIAWHGMAWHAHSSLKAPTSKLSSTEALQLLASESQPGTQEGHHADPSHTAWGRSFSPSGNLDHPDILRYPNISRTYPYLSVRIQNSRISSTDNLSDINGYLFGHPSRYPPTYPCISINISRLMTNFFPILTFSFSDFLKTLKP